VISVETVPTSVS